MIVGPPIFYEDVLYNDLRCRMMEEVLLVKCSLVKNIYT